MGLEQTGPIKIHAENEKNLRKERLSKIVKENIPIERQQKLTPAEILEIFNMEDEENVMKKYNCVNARLIEVKADNMDSSSGDWEKQKLYQKAIDKYKRAELWDVVDTVYINKILPIEKKLLAEKTDYLIKEKTLIDYEELTFDEYCDELLESVENYGGEQAEKLIKEEIDKSWKKLEPILSEWLK
jgi:hypothetical protein